MPTIHLICGFMGFGKTTFARKLEAQKNAVRFTHDEIMCRLYGRNPPEAEFREKYKIVDDMIWENAKDTLKKGQDVILDYGFWSKEQRVKAFSKAQTITKNILFHQLMCPINIAKQRVLNRTQTDKNALLIDENCFDLFLKKYTPIAPDEHLPVVYYTQNE